MNKIELKRLMTDVAKGKISQKEVDMLMKPKKSKNKKKKNDKE